MNKNEIIYSLSHLNAVGIADTSQRGIVIDTIYNKGRGIPKTALLDEIKEQFHIEFTEDIIKNIVTDLITDEMLYSDADDYLWLSPKTHDSIYKNKQFFINLENKVIDEWVSKLPFAAAGDINDSLQNAIRIFINAIFIKHGVASYELISENAHYEEFDIQAIAQEVSEKIDVDNKEIISTSLISFLAKPIPENRLIYLKIIIEKAISYLTCVVNHETIESVKDTIDGLIIYLDTSFLYRLLNLQGDERFKAVNEVIRISQDFGIEFRVSTVTYLELQSRISFDASVVRKYPIKTNLAMVGYRYKTEENYVSAYWKASKETGLSVKDFNDKYKQAKLLLEEFGIIVEEKAIIEEASFLEETRDAFSKISSYEAGTSDPKSDNAAWHDAYNLIYVCKQQVLTASNIIESRCLFMTTDKSILKLQTKDYFFKTKPIISILPSQLLQIICFIKPCDDFYMTFIDFFSSASNQYHNDINNEEINEILGRIGHYSGCTPELACKILENQYIIKRFKNAKDDSEKEEIIYNAVTDDLTERLTDAKEDLELKKEELKEQKVENEDLSNRVESLETKINELSGELEKNAIISEENKNAKEEDMDILRESYASSKWEKWRNIRIGSLILSGILVVYEGVLIYHRYFDAIETSAGGKVDYSYYDTQIAGLIPFMIGFFAFGVWLFKANIKFDIIEKYETEFENDLKKKRKKFKGK